LRTALANTPDGLELQTTLAIVYCLQGAHEQGVRDLGEVLELDPEFSFARYELARILSGLERYDEALHHLDVLSAAEPRDSYAALTAFAAGRSGDPRPARRFLDRSTPHGRRPAHYLRAYAQLGLGERADAVTELRAAVGNSEPWTVLLPLDRIFSDLRGDHGFRALFPLGVAR
jgi:tetratricopeptide (TPR) repeat protein